MGLDDILREKQDQQARRAEAMREAPAIAQGRRLAYAERITNELIHALRQLGDPALQSPKPIPVMAGTGKSRVQVECNGSARVIFMCTVTCELGAREATCSKIEIVLSTGSKTARGELQPTSGSALNMNDIPESHFAIDSAKLRSTIDRIARSL